MDEIIKNVEIFEDMNGYRVRFIAKDGTRRYVYKSTEEFLMLEAIGKFLWDLKIEVKKV